MTLLLAALLLVQDKTAQEAFNRIEETIEKAKTVSVKFTTEIKRADAPKADPTDAVASGTILLKEGNKAYVNFTMGDLGLEKGLLLISDGAKVVGKAATLEGKGIDPPSDMKRQLGSAVARYPQVPLALSLWRVMIIPPARGGETDLSKIVTLSDFESSEDDGKAKTLKYKLMFKGKNNSLQAKLWYDPISYAILKRTFVSGDGKADGNVITETYEEFILDVDIPDEKFKLPEEKK
jgi:outer membrane lipoprotein-sorting protein